MTLDYIYHSGFAIEMEGVTVIIDYYKDSSETEHNRGIVHDYLLQRPGKLYVLATHFHPDHFNREILTWKEQRPDIQYIFSKDILKLYVYLFYIKKGETYEDDTIRIDAFGSTDIGSFVPSSLTRLEYLPCRRLEQLASGVKIDRRRDTKSQW